MATHLSALDRHFTLPATRAITLTSPLRWLARGWQDLRANPGPSLTYGLLITAIGWLLLSLVDTHSHFFTTLLTGFLLLAPLAASGIYELSSEREAGRPTSFLHSLRDAGRNLGQTAYIGVVLTLIAIAWERISAILFALLYGGMVPAETPLWEAFTGQYLNFTLIWVFCGAVLAAFVFALTAVSLPMLADREVDSITAMMTSLRAVMENGAPMLLWAMLIVAITALGLATYLVGLIVLFPLLGHASWHAYRDLVAAED
ncbi:DUF2189 domain-containing protein [Chitinibacter sp. ZOR0017]|uniref:DUF2189 domain-containing protein n=1 Tax=Chitinibacter sp. ZOR0017 TaxID=1339254 RepID=UPI0006470FFA|nr:DUF2189 domain-containing protein [Chitinibacter sp. ZOR0017]